MTRKCSDLLPNMATLPVYVPLLTLIIDVPKSNKKINFLENKLILIDFFTFLINYILEQSAAQNVAKIKYSKYFFLVAFDTQK
jgi:hypothetical protein